MIAYYGGNQGWNIKILKRGRACWAQNLDLSKSRLTYDSAYKGSSSKVGPLASKLKKSLSRQKIEETKTRNGYLLGVFAEPSFDVLQGGDGLRGVPELDDGAPGVLGLQGDHLEPESLSFYSTLNELFGEKTGFAWDWSCHWGRLWNKAQIHLRSNSLDHLW